MAEAVAGFLASALVDIAKDKLASAISEQAGLLWNFSGDLEDMKDRLDSISAVLQDAEKQSVKQQSVRLCLKRLKDVALDISDMLEDYQDTRDQAKAKNLGVLSCLPTAYKKTTMANMMKTMREKLSSISMEFEKFKFIITPDTSTGNVQHYDKRETSGFLPDVKGRVGEKQEIISLIHASTNNDESKTTIVPIYGLGGTGKTTLAQLVYNDHQFKKYDHRIWVYVSQEFNLCKIGSTIISQLQIEGGQRNVDPWCKNLHDIMQCLDELLHGKKVLIVLDDLWEEDYNELMKLKSMLQVDKKEKSGMIDIIVTTREEGIAKNISTNEPYKLQPLNDDICWEIIKKYSNCNNREFELIGLEIARKCGGVPLAAQALGCMLQSKDLSEWKKINDSDIWNETSKDTVLPSLKLSYQRMPQQLRICFSYCAIFPKGHNIVQDDLIHHWSALGFTDTSKGKEYIKQLLGLSFLQVSKLPSNYKRQVVRYTMHDLVLDLARLTMADELMVFDVASQRNARAHKYCYYSLVKNYDRTMKLASNLPLKMRVIRFSSSDELDIQSGAFSFAKCLRTLDFSECSGLLLPTTIGRLKQLRCLIAPRMQNGSLPKCITELSKLQYLNINGSSKIAELPESIGKLGCLEYLCLSNCSGITKLADSFGDLKCMVHLDLSGCSGLTELPMAIGKLGCLKHLYLSGCSRISKLAESFGDLKCMVHLDMSGCSRLIELPESVGNLTNLQHLDLSHCFDLKEVPQSLCGLTQLQYLNLSSCSCIQGLPEDIGSIVGLQHLYMSDCRHIRELPESLMKLQSLSHLNLSGCTGLRRGSLACLRGLTSLQHLDISHFWDFNLYLLDDYFATLTNLEHLDLSSNHKLVYLPESIGNLKRLHTLDISHCYQLNSLPESIILSLSCQLKSLVVDGCRGELIDQVRPLVYSLQTLPVFKVRVDYVNGCSNLRLLEGVDVSELEICCLENVRSLAEANKVKLSVKHNLSKLTLDWSTKRAVQILDDKDLLEQLEPPTGLKSMCLKGYSGTSFPGWLMCAYRQLTNLVSVELRGMPMCSNLPPLGQLPHLEKLLLSHMPSIKRIDREFCGGKGAFRRLSSLDLSYMEGLEEWNTTYTVEDGVEEFMFPVLDSLEIFSCPRLRLKPCPPIFRECYIRGSDQVISSLEEADKTNNHCSPSSRAIKLRLSMQGDNFKDIRLLRHFPSLQELRFSGYNMSTLPESIRYLTSLESLSLEGCKAISGLPEWLGDLSSLKRLAIEGCDGIKSLPACTQQLTKLQTLDISYCPALKRWCESEENKAKLAHINNILLPDPAPIMNWCVVSGFI